MDVNSVGMIDWLTLKLDGFFLDRETHNQCLKLFDRIIKMSSLTGDVIWESIARESIRSDSHTITVSFGSSITIQGSPARVVSRNNVFGSLDIQKCALEMIQFVCEHYQIILPRDLKKWSCSKIDVTQNFDLGSLAQVKEGVDYFKPLKIGNQKTSTEETTVMWGKGSALHMGKIYAKGPHARKMVAGKSAFYTEIELQKADRLIRVEYSIRRLMIRRLRENARLEWYQLTPEYLLSLHSDYFSKFISSIEVVDMGTVLEKLLSNVGKAENQIPTEGRARAAYDCYLRCREIGYHQAKDSYPQSTFYKHVKYLGTIGLDQADLQPSNVVPLRRRPILLDKPVSSWDDIQLVQRA